MKNGTKKLCRAGVIAALYVALTYACAPISFGGIQFRPAEALCLLPLFFVESVPALFIGCMLSNVASPFFLYDVFLGSFVTLLAAICTFLIGKTIKSLPLKIILGGLFPVLFNAFLIPIIIVFLCGGSEGFDSATIAYFSFVLSLFITQSVCVYGIGTPLCVFLNKMREKSNPVFL